MAAKAMEFSLVLWVQTAAYGSEAAYCKWRHCRLGYGHCDKPWGTLAYEVSFYPRVSVKRPQATPVR